jgi:2-polyprenyl-3-methyl-5-hydroxy-6-metoxy-1,4-benzoquinol methylase
MDIPTILQRVEAAITDSKEREYFLIHEARYKRILSMIPGILGSNSEDSGNHTLRVLDVGCFPYHLGSALEMMGYEVYGISSAHEPMDDRKILLRPAVEAGLRRDHSAYAEKTSATQSNKIKICNIESDKFPFKDNFFDLVVCTEVLEHLPQSPLHALQEIRRVLMPQGRILLTTPNIARSINRAKLLLGKSVTYPLHQLLENDGAGSNIYHRHNREYTLTEVTTILTHTHFSVDTATTFVSYTPNRRRIIPDPLWLKAGKTVNYILMIMVSGLRDTLLVVARK